MSLYIIEMGDHLEIIIFFLNFTDLLNSLISLRELYKTPINDSAQNPTIVIPSNMKHDRLSQRYQTWLAKNAYIDIAQTIYHCHELNALKRVANNVKRIPFL